MIWTKSGHRGEYTCEHGIGHGNHVHGCDGCCSLPDYPLKGVITYEGYCELSEEKRSQLLNKAFADFNTIARWRIRDLDREERKAKKSADGA